MELELTEVPKETREEFESYPNVTGTGIGPKQRAGQPDEETESVIVFVTKKVSEADLGEDEIIPSEIEIDGKTYETDVQESGEVRALELELTAPEAPMNLEQRGRAEIQEIPESLSRTRRWRPAPAGVSCGHPDITAGTLGTQPLRTQDDRLVFLTNSHVAANSGQANRGDTVLQPGPYDGGSAPDDAIGSLLSFNAIDASTSAPYPENKTDSALVEVKPDHLQTDIWELHEDLREFTDAQIGAVHVKSGRTTGVTRAKCTARHASFNVQYSHGVAKMVDLDVFNAMAAGGDSGSLIGMEQEDGFYGTSLLFAGSSSITLGVPMDTVQAEHGRLTPVSSQDLVDADDMRVTGTAFRVSLDPSQVIHRWSGPWDDRYAVDFVGHPVNSGDWVDVRVASTYRTASGIYYQIRAENKWSSRSADCDVNYSVTR
ncbi:hypothetical protein ACOZ4I_12845 [Haloarcula salina]|uniref:hypothetical protein n=1 Tax=Haloarcula salina TaxID=1429914 RepID=UPI003C702FC9